METAEKQVTDVVKCDIHLDYTADGKRYIDRISEITQLEEGIPYPEYNPDDAQNSMNVITKEFYQRSTDRVGFTTRLILKYNLDTDTYYTVDRFSEYLENRLRDNLNKDLRVSFDEFMLREWGPRKENYNFELTQEEIDEKLEDLQGKIAEINKKYEGMQDESNEYNRVSDDNDLDDQIALEAAQNELWKQGYSQDTDDSIPNKDVFSLDFFSDSDYE